MSMPPAQPFGRRGRPAPAQPVPLPRAVLPPSLPPSTAADLTPETIAAIVGGARPLQATASGLRDVTKVNWSLRAAILAGLIVGLLNAALRATTFLGFDGFGGGLDKIALGNTPLGHLTLGEATLPLALLVTLAGLWSGARASALSLLIAHKILARRGWTQIGSYALGGLAVSLAYGLGAALLGFGASPAMLLMEALSGLGAGFFYRLFAATERG